MLTLSVIKHDRISGYELKLSKWYIEIIRLSGHTNLKKKTEQAHNIPPPPPKWCTVFHF
jgi:hypothetical protein